MPTIKEIKQLSDTGYVGTPIGCDAENVDLADGRTLEEFVSSVKEEISEISSNSNITIDAELSAVSENPVQNKVITAELDAIKKSVSDGKTAVANAITAKGVTTATDAAFTTMAENITSISSGSGNSLSLNVFTQKTEPETKNGVWIQTANPYENIMVGSESYSNPAIGDWGASVTLPYSFYNGSAIVYENKIHIFSGYSNGTYTSHYAFDGANWTQVSTLPYSFYGGSAIVYNNKIHILGGYASGTDTKHYVFDGTNWTEVSTLPYSFHYSSAIVYDNKIHILGSSSNTYVLRANHYAFDGTNWTSVSTLPRYFCSGGAVVYNNKIHILGGGGASNAYTSHYAFDGMNWTEVSTLPYSFRNGGAVVYNNKMHILGGYNSGTDTKHYVFDGTTWTQVSTLPYSFYNGSAVVYDNKIHILGSSKSSATYTKHYFISFVSEQYAGTTVAIYQNPSNTTGTYATDFFTDVPISGKNNKFPSGFDNVYYIDSSLNVEESPTYYGDGTQWIKLKN